MKKIDIHIHFKMNQPDVASDNESTQHEKMISYLKSQKIDYAIALSFGESPYMSLADNKKVHEICSQYPEFLSWMCSVSELEPEKIGERIKKYKKSGAVGIGEFHVNLSIGNEIIQEVFKQAQINNMPILFHMGTKEGEGYGIVDVPGLYLLEESLIKYPNLKFIGHSQPFWCEISSYTGNDISCRDNWVNDPIRNGGRLVELLNKYSNLYCDLSAGSGGRAITRDEDFGVDFLKRFSDRLFYGTDTVDCSTPYPLVDWIERMAEEGRLDVETLEKIFFQNANRIFEFPNYS